MFILTPLGEAEAHFLQVPINNDNYVQWGCFINETKENWWFDNTMVRIVGSCSGRRDSNVSPFFLSQGMLEMMTPHILRHKRSPLYEKVVELTKA